MLRARIGVGLAMAFALAAVPGPAQRVPDWRQSHLLENEPPVSTLYRVATCLAIRNRDEARALLDSRPGSAEEAAAFAELVPDEGEGCLASTRRLTRYPRSLLGDVALVRGAIAEALIRTGGVPVVADPAAADPVTAAGQEVPLERRVAECAAARESETALDLLGHNPGSPGEYRGLTRLRETLAACLPPGESLRVGRLKIRALLAEALYRRAAPASDSRRTEP